MCAAIPTCKAFALSFDWNHGEYPQCYVDGAEKGASNSVWTLFDNTSRVPSPPPPTPAPPPPVDELFMVNRQAVLMRYMVQWLSMCMLKNTFSR